MFNFDFDTDSTLTNDTDSTNSTLDWSAFQSSPPPIITTNPFLSTWLSRQDDAVAPNNRSNVMITPLNEDEMYYEIEQFFNGLNQQQEQGIIEPIHVNTYIPDQSRNDINHIETPVSQMTFDFVFDYIKKYTFSIAYIYHQLLMNDHRLVYQHHLYRVFHHHVHNVIINYPIMLLN